jgi:hypothetical protein
MTNQTIDRKFIFTAVNPCNGKFYTEENAIVFCAKDAAVPKMLTEYLKKCEIIGCDSNHIHSISLLIERVLEYQEKIEKRVPDTKGECELARCIDGKT